MRSVSVAKITVKQTEPSCTELVLEFTLTLIPTVIASNLTLP